MRCDYKLNFKRSQEQAWGITVKKNDKDLNTIFILKFETKNTTKIAKNICRK